MNKILWLRLGLVACLFAGGPAFPQEAVPTNQAAIVRTLISPTLNILAENLPSQASLTVTSPQSDPLSAWLTQILIDSCLSQRYFVYSAAEQDTSATYSVAISVPQVTIQYRPAGRKWLLFGKGWKRSIAAGYFLRLQDRRGRILVAKEITGIYADTISSGALKGIENPSFSFTQGTKLPSPFIKRWLEPVIITASTLTVIFLFYTLRSDT